MKYIGIFFCAFIVCFQNTNVVAQVPDNLVISGFGGWAYGKTNNDNRYLAGNKDGNYEFVNFSLNISAHPSDKLSVHVQPGWSESLDGSEVGLDYAFAEWAFVEAFIVRAGKVKAPFMLSTEVYDVGTIRPFFVLPQGIYQEFTAKAYSGAGITGTLPIGLWEILYDVYGGRLNLQSSRLVDFRTFSVVTMEMFFENLIGGRLIVRPPIDQLNVSFSAYSGNSYSKYDGIILEDNPFADDKFLFTGVSAEYLTDHWWLRSEYLGQKKNDHIDLDTWYVELAYMLTDHWQVAARYDFEEVKINDRSTPFSDHKDAAAGINYWFTPNLVIKSSLHYVEGNRFAQTEQDEALLQDLRTGELDEETILIMVGVQFSF